jgi:hypothetical protein
LQSAVEVQQEQRPVLTLDLQLPVDLALIDLPLAPRLVQAPVDIRLHMQQPNLVAVQRWQPALPALTGTLQGSVALQGTYTLLNLDANLQLQRLGLAGSAEQLQASVHLNMPRLRLDTLPLVWPAELPALVQGQLTVRGSVPAPQVEARLQYAGGQIQANLAVQLQDPLPRYRATLRLEGLEMHQLHTAAQGRLQASVQLQGQDFSGAERQASIELSAPPWRARRSKSLGRLSPGSWKKPLGRRWGWIPSKSPLVTSSAPAALRLDAM